MLLDIGRQALLARLIGQTEYTVFDNVNAHIAVGNGTTAAAVTDTDMVGLSKARKVMDASYPQRAAGSRVVTWRATYGTADANFDWQEAGVVNAATGIAAPAAMLNRFLTAQGVKANTATWQFTITTTLA